MLEEKLARVRKLMEQREKIDAELAGMLGMSTAPKRGRPRKDQANGGAPEPAPESTVGGQAADER
jgi:hypothetical protein